MTTQRISPWGSVSSALLFDTTRLAGNIVYESTWLGGADGIKANKFIGGWVTFDQTADNVPLITFHNACVTDRSLTFMTGTEIRALELQRQWSACCASVSECPPDLGVTRILLCNRFGLYSSPTFVVNISFLPIEAQLYRSGPSLLMEIAINDFYQYGHSVSRFVQTAVLDIPLARVVVNKHHRPPGGIDQGQDETNMATVYNMTLRTMGVPVEFTAGKPACFGDLLYVANYERPFYSARQAALWRGIAGAKLGMTWQTCPPGRAVLLKRPEEKLTDRRFVNEELIDSIAASLGIPRLHRVTISSKNSTYETARLFASFGLMVTVHSSQLKGLLFASPNTAVIEMGGAHLGMWRPSAFSEGMVELGIHYNLSRYHYANVTVCGRRCSLDDKNAPVTVHADKFRGALSAVLAAQRGNCPALRYDGADNL